MGDKVRLQHYEQLVVLARHLFRKQTKGLTYMNSNFKSSQNPRIVSSEEQKCLFVLLNLLSVSPYSCSRFSVRILFINLNLKLKQVQI